MGRQIFRVLGYLVEHSISAKEARMSDEKSTPNIDRRSFLRRMGLVSGVAVVPVVASFTFTGCFEGGHGGGGNT
jgi:hypothetical protein